MKDFVLINGFVVDINTITTNENKDFSDDEKIFKGKKIPMVMVLMMTKSFFVSINIANIELQACFGYLTQHWIFCLNFKTLENVKDT